jgi:uncharacterized repeat protein (TIGR03803 family)
MGISYRSTWLLLALLVSYCAVTPAPSSAQTLTTLYSFCSQGLCTDGSSPTAGLIQGIDGNFYGTTAGGGEENGGTIFKISSQGVLTTLFRFCNANCYEGAGPYARLVVGTDGNFYGTTVDGGTNDNCRGGFGCGTVFQLTPGGTLTVLYNFCSQSNCSDGTNPSGALVQGQDGNFYGTTAQGGSANCPNGCGTVFTISPSGTLTTLHSFVGTDGGQPFGGLVRAADGTFYGTTSFVPGTVFRITSSGIFTTLYNFCSQPNCADGNQPDGGLVQAADGNFYGVTPYGGTTDAGTVFKMTPGGALTTLHDFCVYSSCSDGKQPHQALVQATDGNLYGTTYSGGILSGQYGTLFELTLDGSFTTLYQFCSQLNCADGTFPRSTLLQATDGSFYGTTSSGGAGGGGRGTVFRLSTGLSPFIELQPTSGRVGTPVTILGTNLTGATSVAFNGTPATFNVVSASEITTTVPAGATTGTVQVTVGGNTPISNTDFQVVGPIQFVPVTPCRLVDTRQNGGHPIQGGTSENFTIPQLGGCGVPASAAAYSLNVTVVPQGPLGYLTIWPQGEIQPFVSTMNSGDGRIKANAVIVPSGNNAASVYVTDTTDVVLDINGYFASPSGQTLQFYPLTPCRVADTRKSDFPQGLGTPHLSQGGARDFPVLASSCIPQNVNAAAYSFNITAIPYPSLGYPLAYLEVWPTGQQPQHPVSTLNNPTATYVANAAIVPAGTDGKITAFASDDTDLAVDVNGYFAAPGTDGLSLYPTLPCRVFDTRKVGGGQPFSGTLAPPVDVVDGPCGVPSSAQAYVFNSTVVPSPTLSYLTLWPDGQNQPVVSTLNAADGWIMSNMAIVPNLNGSVDAYAAGMTQLILDISSYFAP